MAIQVLVFTEEQFNEYQWWSQDGGLSMMYIVQDGNVPPNYVCNATIKTNPDFDQLWSFLETLPVIDWVPPIMPPEEQLRASKPRIA